MSNRQAGRSRISRQNRSCYVDAHPGSRAGDIHGVHFHGGGGLSGPLWANRLRRVQSFLALGMGFGAISLFPICY